MVYVPPARLRSRFKSSCDNPSKKKRTLSVGASVEQKPWKPTVRRGRIAAEPLPGAPSYKSVPPLLGPKIIDSKKKSAPAYSIGKRTQRRVENFLEGPAKFNIAGLTNTGVNRSPAFSIIGRRKDIKKLIGPGANRYEIKSSYEATVTTIPKYSFGKRPVPIKTLPTPAANVYNLPPIFGTSKEGKINAAPAFSLLGREKPRQIPAFVLPGPGQYADNSKYFTKTRPKYSFHIKHKVISDGHMKPGPAAHCPEKYIKNKSVPAPSFSIHHTPYLGQRKSYLVRDCVRISMPSKPNWLL